MTHRTLRARTYAPASGTMTGAMDTPRWNDAQLDAMRQTQDPVADPVVAALFAAGKVDAVNSLMRTLVENDGLPPGALPVSVTDYLAATGGLPDWADPAKIAAGERVFWRYGPAMIAILHCYALPFCYAGRKGVQVLALTARLTGNPARRVIETAQMVVDVMRPGGLGAEGSGIRTAQKVRLMHAGVRCLIGQYPGWKPEFDLPINQEDLAGTLLSFSYISLDGLQRLGYVLSNDEIEGYLHAWKVAGHILGIRPEMLPVDYADATAPAARIPAPPRPPRRPRPPVCRLRRGPVHDSRPGTDVAAHRPRRRFRRRPRALHASLPGRPHGGHAGRRFRTRSRDPAGSATVARPHRQHPDPLLQ